MFDITFYQMNKKPNSSARPTESMAHATATGSMRSDASILSPVLYIDFGTSATDAPSFYNYAYIAEFSRYYWVTDWTFANNLWVASLQVDVLASWRYYIERTNFYVTRTSVAQTPKVSDNYWASLATTEYKRNATGQYLFPTPASNGYYVCGIGSKPVSSEGAYVGQSTLTTYYVFTHNQFCAFADDLYKVIDESSSLSDSEKEIMSGLSNPMDYIYSVRWYPFKPATTGTTYTIHIGYWSITPSITETVDILDTMQYTSKELLIPLATLKHPQAATYGEYMNAEPYTSMVLECQPWGTVQLNASMLYDADYLSVLAWVDCVDGSASLWVRGCSGTEASHTITCSQYAGSAQVGCSLAISGSYSKMGELANVAGGVASSLYNALGLDNVFGEPDMGAVGTMFAGAMNTATGKGSDGSIMSTLMETALRCQYTLQADRDISSRGLPYCKVAQPVNLGYGYYKVMDGEVPAPATQAELNEIQSLCESGFYYEV